MTKKLGKVSEETYDLARELFVEGAVSDLKELSDRSEELLGQFVGHESLKLRSNTDPKGIWSILKAQTRVGNPDLELEDIRAMIYLDIMNPETAATARAQLTNSYMTLRAKGGANKRNSAKTSRQQVLDLKDQAKAELALDEDEMDDDDE